MYFITAATITITYITVYTCWIVAPSTHSRTPSPSFGQARLAVLSARVRAVRLRGAAELLLLLPLAVLVVQGHRRISLLCAAPSTHS